MRFDDPARLRRIILWVMLVALGLSAALAVVGVLTTNIGEEYQMIGTGIAAAVASGLLLASCKFLDSEKSRQAGLMLMAVIVFEFILVLVALWNPLAGSSRWRGQEALTLTAVCFPVVALPATIFFHIRQFQGGRLAAFLGMAMCAVTFIAFLRAIWGDYAKVYSPDAENYWGVGWSCWLFAVVGSAATAGFGTDRRHWRWIGFAAAVTALAMAIYGILHQPEPTSDFFIIITTLAVLIAHINVMWLCKLKRWQEFLRLATTAFAVIACLCFDYAAIEQRNAFDITWRFGMAAGICAGCGTVAVAILAVFNRRTNPVPAGSGIDLAEIPLACPCCHHKLSIALKDGVGEIPCSGCGMIYNIRVRAPRCPGCGYILLMFQGERCPECGAAVTPSPGPALA
jgi:hypothetical protein